MRTECTKPTRSWPRRALWFGLWGLLGIILLALSLYAIEDWRGRAAWAKFKRQYEDTPATDLLQKFTPYEAELKELYAEAAQRTKSRPEFEQRDDVNSFALPNLAVLRNPSQSLALHAGAELALGQSNVAWQDLLVLQRLAETLQPHPGLVSAMVRVAVVNLMIQPVWEGLAANR